MVGSIGSTVGMSSSYIYQMQEKLFNGMDTNGDGRISKGEMSQFQAKGPQGGPSVDDIFSSADSDSDGALTKLEFEAGLSKLQQRHQQQRGDQLFSKIDTNGDGSVSQAEFVSNRPQGVSEDQAKQMWSKLDSSKSGILTASQFASAMAAQVPPPGPPPGGFGDHNDTSVSSSTAASSSTASSNSSTAIAANELLQALLAAIRSYRSAMSQSGSSSVSTSTAISSVSTVACPGSSCVLEHTVPWMALLAVWLKPWGLFGAWRGEKFAPFRGKSFSDELKLAVRSMQSVEARLFVRCISNRIGSNISGSHVWCDFYSIFILPSNG
jgi:Ca2+-binding EF-hand superfamily protein